MTDVELRQLISELRYKISEALPTNISDRELNYVYSALIGALSNTLQQWLKEDIK